MQGKDWGILLRRIPTNYHEGITLATITFIGYEEVAWGMMTAAAIVTIIPELILAMLVQKHIVRGLTYGAVKE